MNDLENRRGRMIITNYHIFYLASNSDILLKLHAISQYVHLLFYFARLAQLVEHHIDIVGVTGSSPVSRTFMKILGLVPSFFRG